MASETLSFDILAKDAASRTFKDVGRAAAEAAGGVKDLSAKLRDVDGRTARARVALDGNKEAQAALDQLDVKLLRLGRQVSNPDISLQGAARAQAQISALNLELDKLDKKTARPSIASKLAGASFFQPSALGTAAALLPTLIPLAGGLAAGVAAIGVSFGAATLAAGGFGIAAKSVLSGASQDAQKVQALQTKLATATTAAGKKVIQDQITAITQGWTPAYKTIVGDMEDLPHQWKAVAIQISASALVPWLDAVKNGLHFLVPLLKPVADEFQAWGQAIDRYFKSKAGSAEMTRIATAVGQFASLQLADIVQFIRDVGTGIFNLGKDLAGNGVYFGAFGDYLAKWGDEFANWSKSAKARADVQGFLSYMHENGGLVVSVMRDLGKILPGILQGVSGTGQLELQAISGLLGFIAKLPKGWQAPLTEAAGAILLLSKTGVLKVGFTVVGAAAGWIKKLIGGASVDLGAAGMQTAGDTMLAAAGAMQKAADTMAGAGVAGAGEGAAGAGAGAAGAGAGAAEGGTMAALGAASVPVAVGIISGVAIAQLVNNDAASRASQAIANRVMKQNNLTPADIAAGKQTGGVVPGVPKSSIGSWQTYDGVIKAVTGDQDKNAISQKAQAAAAQLALTRNQQLSDTFRNKLIPDLNTMHADTPKVRTDVSNLADSILNTGNRSAATRGDRQKLIADLENAGVNAKTATGFVNGLQKKIDAMHGKTVKVGVTETGVGRFTIAQVSSLSKPGGKLAGPLGSAAGRLVTGGVPGRDSVLIAAMPGEAVVPKHLTPAVAPFLKAHGVPGFGSGGYVGSPAGLLGSFTSGRESAFQSAVTSALKSAMTSALRTSIRQAAAFSSAGGPASYGVTRWAPLILKVLAMLGQSSANLGAVEHRMQQESGGNPFAINLTDSNAAAGDPSRGLMQTIGSTFARYRSWSLPDNIYNPEANIFAGLNYALHAYAGRSLSSVMLQPGGYDQGGWLKPGLTLAYNGTGRPERVIPPSRGGGAQHMVLEVRARHGATNLERALVEIMQKFVLVNGGGDVQAALGSKA